MRVVRGFDQVYPEIAYPVLTIGNFDGVHLGHQDLIRNVVKRARSNGGNATVLCFDPHPLKILAPEKAPRQIQTLDQRLNSFSNLGVDFAWVIPFSKKVSMITAESFVKSILVGRLGVREICVGKHFVFGRDRQGNIGYLKELGPSLGFKVLEMEELRFRGFRISSTRIRHFLADGRVTLASRILGRPASIKGYVVVGSKKGRLLGFPTANLHVENELLPKTGVYVTSTIWNGRSYRGLTNVGYRPTMHVSSRQEAPIVETHLLEFSGNLYGEAVELQFLCRLRDERQFPSVDALVQQISSDRHRALRYFRRAGKLRLQELRVSS